MLYFNIFVFLKTPCWAHGSGKLRRNTAANERIRIMEHLKEKGSLQIYEAWSNIRYKYRNRGFCRKGHYVDTAGKNAPAGLFVRRSGVICRPDYGRSPRKTRGSLLLKRRYLYIRSFNRQ